MEKIRIFNLCWFLMVYTIVCVLGKTEVSTLCEHLGQGDTTAGCQNDEKIILKKITYGESLCQDVSNSDICHSNISNYFNNYCLGNNNCTLSTNSLFTNNCQRPPRRLFVTFKCNWWFLSWTHTVYTCANSLKEVNCPPLHHIHITKVVSYSGCDNNINTQSAITRLMTLCDDKRRCSPDTYRNSSLFHSRFISVSYLCKESTDFPVTDSTQSTSSGPTDRPVTESIYSTPRGDQLPMLRFDKNHRIEIYHHLLDQSLYLCSYGWDDLEADVLCKSFNRNWTGTATVVDKLLDKQTAPISMNCSGLEASVFECNYTVDEQGCNITKVAGAICCQGTGRPGECFMNSSTIIFAIQSESSTIAGIASTLVSIIVAAFLIIVIVCYRKKKAKISEPCRTANMTKEERDSSDYNEMTDINILKIKKNINETPTKKNQPLNIKTSIEQDQNKCNKYESVSADRNSVEHFYDSGSININQYESLTNPRESDKHTYESSEQALPQDITTSIEQEDNIGNKYESLSTNRNSVEHVYESDLINTNQYESLKKPRKSDTHTYETADIAQTHDIKIGSEPEDIICNKYESLSTNRNSVEHTYESTEQTLPVSHFQSLTNHQESDKHLYSTTEYRQ